MGRNTGRSSSTPAERLRLAVRELSAAMEVIRVGRTAEVLTADGTAAYRAYSAVQDPQLLLLDLIERAVARRWNERNAPRSPGRASGSRNATKRSSRREPPPRPVVGGTLTLRCIVPSGFGGTPRSIVLRIQPDLHLAVHDAQGEEFLAAGNLTEDGIEWSPCPMALSELAREMLDTYAEGVGRVFGDGLVTVQDWTNDRRARRLFALGS
jgi:hypothetical protein